MSNRYRNHPLASAQGVFVLALWSVYSLYAALSYPDVLTSVLIGASSASSPAWLWFLTSGIGV
jgi:hypothetical protein